MKKITLFFIVLVLFPLFLFISCASTYTGRLLSYGGDMYGNFSRLPSHTIEKSDEPFFFIEGGAIAASQADKFETITWMTSEGSRTAGMTEMLEETESLAFLVIKDDVLIYEQYFGGCGRETLFPAFSVSKSITSALIGIAVDEGLLPGIDVPVSDYVPQFSGEDYEKITIGNLLYMNAGFEHSFGLGPGDDLVISSLHPDVSELAMEQTVVREPGECFEYNNYNTIVLGLVLQNATGMTPSEYLERKIWKPVGMEHDGFWSLSREGGIEYMGAGINATLMDYAKFGRLYLNGGKWKGRQIVSAEWAGDSTGTDPSVHGADDYYDTPLGEQVNEFLANEGYYGGHWWGVKKDNGDYDYYAAGMFGQYIYICPAENTIVLRMGRDYGDVLSWSDVFRDIIGRL